MRLNALVLTLFHIGSALDNGLGLAGPAMGWSSWNHFGNNGSHCHCPLGAKGLMEIAAAMVESGLRDAGYRYVNQDGGWASHRDNTTGKLVPDPFQFPHGIKPVVDYIHSKVGVCVCACVCRRACCGYTRNNNPSWNTLSPSRVCSSESTLTVVARIVRACRLAVTRMRWWMRGSGRSGGFYLSIHYLRW